MAARIELPKPYGSASELSGVFGRNVKAVRLSMGLSQKDAARMIGVTQGYLSRIELGRHDSNLSIVERVSKRLGVDASRLLEGTGATAGGTDTTAGE